MEISSSFTSDRETWERQKLRRTTRPDKHVLYEKSVQAPDADVSFIKRVFKKRRGRAPATLREDFCGTAALCCDWVRSCRNGKAFGIDLDKPTLEWSLAHNVADLGQLASRVRLIHGNVLDTHPMKTDVLAAFNFSYFTFKDRSTLLRYFRCAHDSLNSDGIFFLDIYGGPASITVQEEETDFDGFTYIWDQARYSPVTGETLCHIHFRLHEGKTMRRAFTYDWRLWTIPELRDVLEESGFKEVAVYWEGTDSRTGKGNGVFRPSLKGDDSESFIAYIAALR